MLSVFLQEVTQHRINLFFGHRSVFEIETEPMPKEKVGVKEPFPSSLLSLLFIFSSSIVDDETSWTSLDQDEHLFTLWPRQDPRHSIRIVIWILLSDTIVFVNSIKISANTETSISLLFGLLPQSRDA